MKLSVYIYRVYNGIIMVNKFIFNGNPANETAHNGTYISGACFISTYFIFRHNSISG